MTDKELLELAAKAYWGDEIDDVCSVKWSDEDQSILYTHGENQYHNGFGEVDAELVWNPLTDDGDAFRLAVRLKIEVYHGYDEGDAVYAGYYTPSDAGVKYCIEYYDDITHIGDACSATRRAIVRAATEIEKTNSLRKTSDK